MKLIPFKLFLNETKKLPIIQTTGLSSNQPKANTGNNLPIIQTTGLSSNQIKEEISQKETEDLHHELVKHYTHSKENAGHLGSLTLGSRGINEHLAKEYVAGHPTFHGEHNGYDTKKIDAALHEHRTPKAFHVYSGLHNYAQIKNKTTYQHPAYLHTSLSLRDAGRFAKNHSSDHDGNNHRHFLKIHVPKGHPGSYVSHVSLHPGEKEFILPRDTKLHIHHHETIKRTGGMWGTYYDHIHHASPISDAPKHVEPKPTVAAKPAVVSKPNITLMKQQPSESMKKLKAKVKLVQQKNRLKKKKL